MRCIIPNIVLLALLAVSCGQKVTEVKEVAGPPEAEWNRATAILIHTPGEELFDGVIHPSAGLFEHYFDVDKAAAEHLNYVSLLEKNGIKVIRVRDVLSRMDRERLVSLAAQTLVYDVNGVAPQDSAAFGEQYRQQTLSVMSVNDLIRIILLQPRVVLRSTDNNTTVEAAYVHNPLMNLYFTRDQSISTPRGQVICRMNSSQRDPETRIIRACYEQMGITPVYEVTGEGRLEGGDYFPAAGISFIGCGMRTNMEAIRQLMEADAFGHDTVIVVKDHLRWQMEMHLDTHFNIIDKDLCTMQRSRMEATPGTPEYCTADVYVRAKGEQAYTLSREEVGFNDLIRTLGYTIIPIDRDDELHYANNYLTIAPRHIMAVGGQSENFRQALQAKGVKVEWIPLESLICGYGAAHCMTQVLSRENAGPSGQASR